MRYVAFVSFRHVDPDQRWAKWLHTRIEGYRLPKGLLKSGAASRVGRVFRDAEELAACTDLPQELKAALAESQYLIVICSPNTAGSDWVNQEIREFAALGRHRNILALLVRGEPAEAFPPVFKELGIQPLAADVRLNNRHARKDAELRLLATLIGCKYDDLRQREHERRLRQAMFLTAVMTFVAAGFFVLAIVALIQRDTARSRELAINSGLASNDDAELSVLLAVEALRVRPTYEAESALRDGLSHDLLRHVLRGNTGALTRVAFSPDGTRLVTASDQGTLQLWNTETARSVFSVNASRAPIASVSFSPGGQLLLSAGTDDPVAHVWNVSSGHRVRDLTGHTEGLTHAEFSHDGKSLLTASIDGTARVWNVQSGQMTAMLPVQQSGTVNTASFSVDDLSVFTAGDDSRALRWDLSTRRSTAMYKEPWDFELSALTPSPDGKLVAIGTRAFARILDARDLQLRCELESYGNDLSVTEVRFSANSAAVVAETSGESRVATLSNDPKNGICPSVQLVGHDGSLNAVAITPSGRIAATASDDHTGRLWDTLTGRTLFKMLGHQGPLTDVAVSNDGQLAATASSDGSVRIWQINSSRPRRVLTGTGAAMAPVGTHVLTWTDTAAEVWDINDGHEVAPLTGQTQKINDAVFNADATLLLTVDQGGTARTWNAATGDLIRELHADATPLSQGRLSRDGQQAAVVSSDGRVRIWNIQTGKLELELRGTVANSVMFSDDGRRLLTVSADGTARIWDASNGSALIAYRDRRGPIRRATFTPDGADVLSIAATDKVQARWAWDNYPISVWNSRTAKVESLLSGHKDYIHDIVVSADGKLAVSASDDTTAAVWDIRSGIRISLLSGHRQGVQQAAFSADSKFVATTGDCGLRIWDARSGQTIVALGDELGCFTDPQFSADGTTVIVRGSKDANGAGPTSLIAVVPCELCVDATQLLALARGRLSRELTAAERARYLK